MELVGPVTIEYDELDEHDARIAAERLADVEAGCSGTVSVEGLERGAEPVTSGGHWLLFWWASQAGLRCDRKPRSLCAGRYGEQPTDEVPEGGTA